MVLEFLDTIDPFAAVERLGMVGLLLYIYIRGEKKLTDAQAALSECQAGRLADAQRYAKAMVKLAQGDGT